MPGRWWSCCWWWWWWCGGGSCSGGSCGGGCCGGGGSCWRSSVVDVVAATGGRRHRSLGQTVALSAARYDHVLAGRGRQLAVMVADVELRVQFEEVQATAQRVRVEHVPPQWPTFPVETNVPRRVDYRLVPRVSGGQHLLVEQTLRAAKVFL